MLGLVEGTLLTLLYLRKRIEKDIFILYVNKYVLSLFKTYLFTYKMSKSNTSEVGTSVLGGFNNKQLIHIGAEIIVLLGLTFYFSSKNKKLTEHIEELAQRLEDQEDKIVALENNITNLTAVIQSKIIPALSTPPVRQPPKHHVRQRPKQSGSHFHSRAHLQHHFVRPQKKRKLERRINQEVNQDFNNNDPFADDEEEKEEKEEKDEDLDLELSEELAELEEEEFGEIPDNNNNNNSHTQIEEIEEEDNQVQNQASKFKKKDA